MSTARSVWDTFVRVIKIDDQVTQLAASLKSTQERVGSIHDRVVRLEAFMEVALAQRPTTPRRLPPA
jgi:CHAD domain-containing protein